MYKKIGNDDGPGGRKIKVSFLEKKKKHLKILFFLESRGGGGGAEGGVLGTLTGLPPPAKKKMNK